MSKPGRTALILAMGIALVSYARSGVAHADGEPGYGEHPLDRVALEQRLGRRVPLDLTFNDEWGDPVTLRDCMNDRPAVLVLAYYRCPMLCSLVLDGVTSALRDVPLEAGADFNVIVVSIDPQETPTNARKARATLVKAYGRDGAERGWRVLTGEETNIKRLADAVGYRYAYDERTDQYAHPSGIMVVAPGGTLSKYLYGFDYDVKELETALRTAAAGETGSTVTEVLLNCFLYDPTTGEYGLTIVTALRAGGVATILGLLVFIVWSHRKEKRRGVDVAKPRAATEGGN